MEREMEREIEREIEERKKKKKAYRFKEYPHPNYPPVYCPRTFYHLTD